MAFTPLTEEQFNKAIASGYNPEQIIAFEKQRKAESGSDRKTAIIGENTALETAKQSQSVLEKRSKMAETNPIGYAIGKTARDITTIPAHFVNQYLMNAPRSVMNTVSKGAGDEFMSTDNPVANIAARTAGVAGAVMSPINKFALFRAQTLPKMIGAGAVAGGLYSPNENIADIGQRAIGAGTGAVTGGVVNRSIGAMSPVFKPAAQKISDEIDKRWTSAIKPAVTNMSKSAIDAAKEKRYVAVKAITEELPNIKFTDAEGNMVSRAPQSVSEALDATVQTKKAIFKKYSDLASQAGDKEVIALSHKQGGVTTALDEVIKNKNFQLTAPEVVNYAKQLKERMLARGSITPADAQEVIQQLNAKTRNAWNQVAQGRASLSPEVAGTVGVDEMVANNLRQQLDSFIEKITGAQYGELKKTYGALRQVEKELSKASSRIANKNNAGLLDFTDVFTGAQLGAAVFRGDIAGAVGGAAGRGVKEVLKKLNDPNRAIRKIFQTSEKQLPYVGKTTPAQMFGEFIGKVGK